MTHDPMSDARAAGLLGDDGGRARVEAQAEVMHPPLESRTSTPPAAPQPDHVRGDVVCQWLQQSGPIPTPEEYAALRALEEWTRTHLFNSAALLLARIDAVRKEASK